MTLHEPPEAALAWAARVAAARVVSAEPLAGGTSSAIFGLETTAGPLVLRLFTNKNWLAEEPDLARHEAWALTRAIQSSVPTPQLVAFDETGQEATHPAVLMTRLPGKVVLKPNDIDHWLAGMADALASIHALSADDSSWGYSPYVDLPTLAPPAWSARPKAWERAIELVQGPAPNARACFIHRDYHPNNVVWNSERFAGIVDWTVACRGPAGIDVAWCRQNLVPLYGVEAADRFLDHCVRSDPSFSYHPHWDLMGIVESIPFPPDVYPGWPALGFTNLTPELIRDRGDEYLASILARL